MPPTPASRVQDRDALLAEQVRGHIGLIPMALAGGAALAIVLAFVLWDAVEPPTALGWLALFLPPNLARMFLARAYRRAPAGVSLETWLWRFRTASVLHGVAWGVASTILFPTGRADHQAFLAGCLAGMAASSVIVTSFDLVAALGFVAPVLTPLSAYLLLEPGRMGPALGVVLLLFLGYMSMAARRAHQAMVTSVGLRRATASRADALARFQDALAVLRALRPTDADYFAAAAREAVAAMGLTRAVLWLDDTGSGVLDKRAEAGPAAAVAPYPASFPLASRPRYAAQAALGGVVAQSAPGAASAIAELAGTPLLDARVAARLDVPIGIGGRLEGMLWCEHDAPHEWTGDEETFAAAVAAKVLNAVQFARQGEAEQRLREINLHLEELVAARTRELSRSEARLAEALDATNDALWEFDLLTGGVYYSPVWTRLLGYTAAEIRPHVDFFWGILHPDDVGRMQDVVSGHLQGRLPAKEIEVRLRTRSGEYRWFLDHGRVVERAADGTPVRMVGTISDITERKRALQDLRDSEERFRAVFDKSPVIVALVRVADRCLAEMNEAGLRAFGYTRDEVIGRTAKELGLWADGGSLPREFGQRLRDGVVSDLEVKLRRRSGEVFWGLLNSSHVTLDGEPYSLNTVLDVTERRELEARFLQSQKMEVVGHLAGGIAHDFNNLLTVITGTAELAMSDSAAGSPVHESLVAIRDASERAATLTGQLMAFSRRQILQPVPLDLNEVVTALEPMLRRAAGPQVVPEFVPAPQSAMIVADRGSLEQVILNLALNARDAMPDGGRLRVAVALADSALPDTAAPRQVVLTVADTGTGMSDEVQRRVFEPFFTTKPVGKGTGLGLSIAHGVIAQSGGDIAVRSAPGAGTTFTITLPYAAQAVPAATVPAGQLVSGHETILVVDDTREIREVVRRVLTFAGYHVLTAENGADALRVLAESPDRVALLLTDVVMPGVNGRELAARVQASHPDVRVLFTSGYADDTVVRQGVLANHVAFIAKPYSLQALTAKVRDVLDAPA